MKAFASNTAHLHWVLFYDGASQTPAAYAEAQAFTQELMVYHRLKAHDRIGQLLNDSGPNTISELRKAFPSIRTNVFKTDRPSELVTAMIDGQLATAITSVDQKAYAVQLVRMIHLAAATGSATPPE